MQLCIIALTSTYFDMGMGFETLDCVTMCIITLKLCEMTTRTGRRPTTCSMPILYSMCIYVYVYVRVRVSDNMCKCIYAYVYVCMRMHM